MHLSLLPGILLFYLFVASGSLFAETDRERVKVALIDGEPVYHWTHFRSAVRNDIDRALILRAFRRGGYTLPQHFIEDGINDIIKRDYGADRGKLLEALKHSRVTLADFRKFTAEELIVEAMWKRETEVGKGGRPPIPPREWLASLHKDVQIEIVK